MCTNKIAQLRLLRYEGVGNLFHAILWRNQHHRRAATDDEAQIARFRRRTKRIVQVPQLLIGGVDHQVQQLVVTEQETQIIADWKALTRSLANLPL